MADGGPEANIALLEKIVGVQRKIIADEVNPDVTQVPQAWCLYKEVLDFYNAGMSAPDDVTLLWAEDNWGNVRPLPPAEERQRSGGAGVYYHFDNHGGPRNYQWLNTSPIPKIWDQMSLAKQYGANRRCSRPTLTAWSIIKRLKPWWQISMPSPRARKKFTTSCRPIATMRFMN